MPPPAAENILRFPSIAVARRRMFPRAITRRLPPISECFKVSNKFPNYSTGTVLSAENKWHIFSGFYSISKSLIVMGRIKKILLIDDDLDHLLMCNLILRRRSYEVLTLAGCEKMEDLAEAVETFRPDLIFLDHDMRGICGMDLARMLKSHPEFRKIPVIYFSGRDDIVQLAKQAGADSYLRKPLDVNGLIKITQSYSAQS